MLWHRGRSFLARHIGVITKSKTDEMNPSMESVHGCQPQMWMWKKDESNDRDRASQSSPCFEGFWMSIQQGRDLCDPCKVLYHMGDAWIWQPLGFWQTIARYKFSNIFANTGSEGCSGSAAWVSGWWYSQFMVGNRRMSNALSRHYIIYYTCMTLEIEISALDSLTFLQQSPIYTWNLPWPGGPGFLRLTLSLVQPSKWRQLRDAVNTWICLSCENASTSRFALISSFITLPQIFRLSIHWKSSADTGHLQCKRPHSFYSVKARLKSGLTGLWKLLHNCQTKCCLMNGAVQATNITFTVFELENF